MKYNNKWLIERYQQSNNIKFLFFWGHQPRKDGKVTSSCFSQWWEAAFEVGGVSYQTAEHWMMAQKARLFGDNEVLGKILAAKSPGEAKKLGRAVNNFNPEIWDSHKYEIVVTGNRHKFSQYEQLKTFLKHTGDKVLVEASPVDPVWGIGMAADDPTIEDPLQWKGENLLGYALMEIRDIL